MANTGLRQKFISLPESVRDWLTSERTTNTIIDINKRFNVEEALLPVIPFLLTRLVIGNIKPAQVIDELSLDLNIAPSIALSIYTNIEEEILKPIEPALRTIGIESIARNAENTDKESFRAPPPSPSVSKRTFDSPVRPIIPQTSPTSNIPSSKETNIVSTNTSAEEPKPFMLHEEKELFRPTTPRVQSSVSFDIKPAPRQAAPKPITVKVEGGEKEDARVVHYSDLRTPIDKQANSQ